MKKTLKRNTKNMVVAGVISGLADYFEQDIVLFRVIAVAFLILTGFFPGILLYLGAWVVMPADVISDSAQRVDYEVR